MNTFGFQWSLLIYPSRSKAESFAEINQAVRSKLFPCPSKLCPLSCPTMCSWLVRNLSAWKYAPSPVYHLRWISSNFGVRSMWKVPKVLVFSGIRNETQDLKPELTVGPYRTCIFFLKVGLVSQGLACPRSIVRGPIFFELLDQAMERCSNSTSYAPCPSLLWRKYRRIRKCYKDWLSTHRLVQQAQSSPDSFRTHGNAFFQTTQTLSPICGQVGTTPILPFSEKHSFLPRPYLRRFSWIVLNGVVWKVASSPFHGWRRLWTVR